MTSVVVRRTAWTVCSWVGGFKTPFLQTIRNWLAFGDDAAENFSSLGCWGFLERCSSRPQLPFFVSLPLGALDTCGLSGAFYWFLADGDLLWLMWQAGLRPRLRIGNTGTLWCSQDGDLLSKCGGSTRSASGSEHCYSDLHGFVLRP